MMGKSRKNSKGIGEVGGKRSGKKRFERVESVFADEKRAEKALQESEERFRDIAQSIGDLIWEVDEDCVFTYCSEGAERVFGVAASEVVGKTPFDFMSREEAERVQVVLQPIFETKQAMRDIEAYYVHMDGEERCLVTNAVAVLDEKGKLKGYRGICKDITERKRTEEALRGERNLLRTLIDNMPDEIYVKDTDSRFILCNRTVAEHHGASSPDELIGKTDFDLYPGEVAERYCAVEQQIMCSGEPKVKFFEIYLDSKGNEVWGLNTKMPLRDSEGKIIGVVGIGRDVAQEKKAEEALIEERNLLRTVIDNIPDRVYVKDTEFRFVLCNEAVVRHEGQSSAEDVAGKTDFDFYPRDLAEQFLAEERRVIESGEPLINREGVRRDAADEEVCVLTTKVPLRDSEGRITGIVGVNRDITERKRAEEALAREHNLFRTLVDNLPDEIYEKDSESRFVQCNQAVAERAGVETVEELVGKTDFDFYSEEDAKHFYAEEQTVIRTGEPLLNHEELRVDQTGNEIWALINKVPLRDSGGKTVGIVGINRDITERKRAGDMLRRAEEEQRVILDSMSELVIYQDKEHRILRVNRAAAKSVGAEAEELDGRLCYEVWHGRSEVCEGCPLEQVLATGEEQAEEMRLPDGRVWFVRGNPVCDAEGQIKGLVEVVENITERKRAEEALVKERNLLDALISTIPDHIYCKDRQGRFVRGNEATARDFGLSDAKSLVGRSDFDFFAPEYARRLREEEERVM